MVDLNLKMLKVEVHIDSFGTFKNQSYIICETTLKLLTENNFLMHFLFIVANESDHDDPLSHRNGYAVSNGYLAVNKMGINVNPLSHLDIEDSEKPDEVRIFTKSCFQNLFSNKFNRQ